LACWRWSNPAQVKTVLRSSLASAAELKKRWKDGTTHVVLDPLVLMERLCALVPAPRRHLVTYHGVLAAAALDRDRVVPVVGGERTVACRHGGWSGDDAGDQEDVVGVVGDGAVDTGQPGRRSRFVPHRPGQRRRGGRPRYSWADLLRRVFLVDVLVCPHCGGKRRLLAAIHDPAAIQAVLAALGLSGEVPELAPARAPPDEDWVTG